jgi:hypothetical protein
MKYTLYLKLKDNLPWISVTPDTAVMEDKPSASNFNVEEHISVTRIWRVRKIVWISSTDFFMNSSSVITIKVELSGSETWRGRWFRKPALMAS